MKWMTMKEWSLYKEAQQGKCFLDGGNCVPNYSNKQCHDCYGEYVESTLPRCDKKVIIKERWRDVKSD